ncbi:MULTISPECIES: hypothetical protein [unclassified Brachybacterium]|uniref:hypothetical protein n=1 Tax=unclassified Brachybacterium TaxID=2623841 RepID=UPI00361EEA8F
MAHAGSRRRPFVVAAIVVLALLLAGGVVIAALAVRADPAVGDSRPPGTVVGDQAPRGTRFDPARIGQDSLVWATAEGGEVSVSVNRAESVTADSPDIDPGWKGPAKCREYFIIELTVAYEGEGTWEPASELLVQRMAGPFAAHGADPGLEILAHPLLVPGKALTDGESRTGTVMFFGPGDATGSGNLVISVDDGRPLHVRSDPQDSQTGC